MRSAVIVFFAVSVFAAFGQSNQVAPGVLQVGTIQNPDIQESSGIIPVRGVKNAFWTHNDSGLDVLYAINSNGDSLGQWKLKDVDLQNWEDVATAPGRIYIADIGNNTGDRNEVAVYAIPQPPARRSGEVHVGRAWTLTYPDNPFDCESFFVWRTYGYLISKELDNGEARVYRFPLNRRGAKFELQKLCKLNVDDRPRGADITPDGKRLAVITGSGAYLFAIARTIPTDGVVEPGLFVPFDHQSMEGCCFTKDGLMVTSESRDLFLFTDPQFCYPLKRIPRVRR